MRRTPVVVAVGLGLAVLGGAMLARGAAHGPGGVTVAGIVLLVAGLSCLRVAYWRVRVRAMTRAGLALHHDGAGPEGGERGQRSGAP